MAEKACICSDCVFEWLSRHVLGKRVLVHIDGGIIVGKLVNVEYNPSRRGSRTDFALTLQTINGKVALLRWDSLSIFEETRRDS